MLRAARELLAVRSPLDAELMVSELLGTWWGERPPRNSHGDVEELVGEGLVSYAAQQRSPAALALLSGIACLGTPRQAMQAETAALALMEHGVVRPSWAEHVGAVTAGECYVNSDAFGDRDEVVCVYSYAGEEPHALVMVVNYNGGGMLRDGWVTSQVDRLLERCRAAGEGDGGRPARAAFSRVEASQARRLLETALAVTEAGPGTPPSDSFASYHAFIRARIRTLPPARPGHGARNGTGRPAAGAGAGRRRRGRPRAPRGWQRHRGRACPVEHGARVGLGRGHHPAARLDPGPAGHAGGRVPGLRRGGGPVRYACGQPLRGSHHRLRLRP